MTNEEFRHLEKDLDESWATVKRWFKNQCFTKEEAINFITSMAYISFTLLELLFDIKEKIPGISDLIDEILRREEQNFIENSKDRKKDKKRNKRGGVNNGRETNQNR